MASGSKFTVLAALFGNLAIAVFKLIAALLSGSASMLAECYHSFSDTLNQVFLLIGMKRSRKHPDPDHPFGYGKEQFFWALIVALMLFGIAGGLSVREAYHKFRHLEPLKDATLSFIALGFSFIVEAFALAIAIRQFRREMKLERFKGIIEAIRQSKDPALLTVLFEDSLALISVTVAFTCIAISVKTNNPVFDAIGSLIIGTLLMCFALVLANESKKLLIGESITPYRRGKVRKAIESFPEVNKIIKLRTLQMGPLNSIVTADINFKDDLITDQIEVVIDRIEAKIREIIPHAKCFIEVDSE